MMKERCGKIVVTLVVMCVVSSSFGAATDYTATWGAEVMTTDDSKITGITSVEYGKAVLSMELSNGEGRLMEIYFDGYGNLVDTNDTGFRATTHPDDVAYVGDDGSGGDLYYIGRYHNGRGHIEQWATVAGWGSEKADYTSRVLGLDITSNGSNEVIEGLNKHGYLHNFSTGFMPSVVSSSVSYFQGATSLGDINGDGDEDFLFCSGPGPDGNEASFASEIWYMESNGAGGWNTDFLGLTSTVTTFSGISNVGDIDGDGYIELMLTRFSRTDMNYSWVTLIETDIPWSGSGPTIANCDDVWFWARGITGDINHDCYVNLSDLEIYTNEWLKEIVPPSAFDIDDFDRADTSMTTGNAKNVWFTSDIANGWQEWCQGNGGTGVDANAPDAWVDANEAKFFRVGGSDQDTDSALCAIKKSSTAFTSIDADLTIDPWRDGAAYYQDESYISLLMIDSTTGGYAWIKIQPKGGFGDRYLELNYTDSNDGSWNGWLLGSPRRILNAETTDDVNNIACSMEIYDSGGGDLMLDITIVKDSNTTKIGIDWYDEIASFDTVEVMAKWEGKNKINGGGAYMYADNVITKTAKSNLIEDTIIDFKDFAKLADDWMRCNDPTDGSCETP